MDASGIIAGDEEALVFPIEVETCDGSRQMERRRETRACEWPQTHASVTGCACRDEPPCRMHGDTDGRIVLRVGGRGIDTLEE